MDRFWLKSYPAGVPADIDYTQYRSLAHLLEEAFQRHAQRDAFVCMGKTLSYADIDRHSRDLAAWLQSTGLPRGSRVALMMLNTLQYPIAMAAVLRAGYIVVNINPLYTPRELAYQLDDSGAEIIILLENFAATLQHAIEGSKVKHVVVSSLGEMLGTKGMLVDFVVRKVKKLVPPFSLPHAIRFKEALKRGAALPLQPVEVGHEDVAFLQYTGGTTGISKGAMLLHRNVVANTLQADAWLQPALRREPKLDQLAVVCALPLYHIFALTSCCLLGIRAGAVNLLIPNPRDIPGFIKELSRHRFNMLPAVNTLYNALLNHPDFAKLDFSGLRISNGGGMAVQKAVAAKWFAVTGCPIIEGYGLSETSPVVTCNPATSNEYNGSIGVPVPSTEVVILDEEERPVALGQAGEIAVRGPQVMAGYWQRPDETSKVMTADGFFKTGDIGVMDERGYVRIVDRKKDMILVSGFNVYPNEVEDVVAAHAGVRECACVGVPDEHSGEAVKLFVVRKDPALTEEALMAYCREQLTGYKRPKHIEFREELPKTNVGKILRRELRTSPTGA